MTSVLAALAFAGFVATALAAALARRRSAVTIFLSFALAASFGPGLVQRDGWPFASWPLVAGIHPPTVSHTRLVAVDDEGREHDIDFRSWDPPGIDELYGWLHGPFTRLDAEAQDEAAAWLLSIAEEARQLGRAGIRPGGRKRILGPLEAPTFLLHPPIWDDPAEVPARPFVGLRLYMEVWDIEARAAGDEKIRRELIYGSAGPGGRQ